MSCKNSSNQYGSISKFFHWTIAILVIVMLCFGFFLGDLPKAMKGTAYMLHKSTGLLILALMILRILWTLINPKPQLPDTIPSYQRFLSHSVHYLLYVLVLIMPISGWILTMAANKVPSFYGLFQVPLPLIPHSKALAMNASQAHTIIAWLIIGFLSLHILAALKHLFINKDEIFSRMMPKRR